MKKTILVTGAAGFIGFHFAKAAKIAGHQVIAIDNFNTYYDVSLKHARSAELKKIGIDIETIDICSKEAIEALFERNDFTHVVHLAAQAGVRYSFLHPEVYINTNITGFLHILEAIRKSPSIRLVYASSSSVYGLNESVPFKVTDRTDEPSNIYGVTKKTNEQMAFSYQHLWNVSSIGMRFFTVYGPWGRPDMAYYSFAKKIFNNEEIELFNGGDCLRDFTYIDDVVKALLASLDYQAACEIFNIGNAHPESVHALIACIEQELGMKAKKKLLPMQKGEIKETYADIEKTTEALGFCPETSLEEGIKKFISWFKDLV